VPVEIYANLPQTTVASGGATSPAAGTTETWTVSSSSSFPAASNSTAPPTQFQVSDPSLASEIIAVTNVAGTTWTVIRGAEGTTPVAHAAGFTVKQVVTAGDCARMNLDLWTAPSPALRETFPRYQAVGGAASATLTSGTLYLTAIALPQYLTVTNIAVCTKATALTGLSHGWVVLCDNSSPPVVRAVSADQTSGTWLSVVNTPYSLPVAAPYVTAYTGLYYLGMMAAATGMPSMLVVANQMLALVAAAPVLGGSSSTAQTTPPSAGASVTAITAATGYSFYGFVS
jgi:hypothetical protein